jgi:hypothetical protein
MLGGLDGVVRFGLWVRGGLNDDWKVLEGIVSNEEKSDAARLGVGKIRDYGALASSKGFFFSGKMRRVSRNSETWTTEHLDKQ